MADQALIDLDSIAQGSATPVVEPWALRAVEEPKPEAYKGVTISPKTFKNKVKFDWREEAHGANTLYSAICRVCHDPMWLANDLNRTQLRMMTSAHKDKHYWKATGNTPTPLREGAVD